MSTRESKVASHRKWAASRPLSALGQQIAAALLSDIAEERFPGGAHLPEQALAAQFQVSRSPVREALIALAEQDLLEHQVHRGFFVRKDLASRALERARRAFASADGDALHFEIGAQRLAGAFPEQFTEADLGRRLGLQRSAVSRAVDRMAREGWIEPRRGYGWRFTPVLTTPEAFALSYRFRLLIEPAALLEPTFAIDRATFQARGDEQTSLVRGRIRSIGSVELFSLGSRFHETLAGWSGNPFFLEAVQRINRQRRLLEYRAMVNTAAFVGQAREHLEILDLLRRGRNDEAAALMRRHLDVVKTAKLDVLSGRANGRKAAGWSADLTAPMHF
jgi:DNA-binding GntR family transcriptional regulator